MTPTASCSIVNGWRSPPNRASRHGVSSTVHPLSRFGNVRAYSSRASFTAAWACAIETPGFKRPTARSECCVSCAGDGFEAEREPGVGRIVQEPEALWHDAEDQGGLSVDLHGLVDDVRAAGKSPLPHRVAENHGGWGVGLLVGGDREPAQQRCGAERREARRRNSVPVQSFSGASGVAREVGRSSRVEDADGVERRAGPVAQKEIQRRRQRTARFRLAGRRHAHVQEPVGLRVRHGLDQHRAREAEDQDVEAHPEGQRRQGDGGEPGVARRRRRAQPQITFDFFATGSQPSTLLSFIASSARRAGSAEL